MSGNIRMTPNSECTAAYLPPDDLAILVHAFEACGWMDDSRRPIVVKRLTEEIYNNIPDAPTRRGHIVNIITTCLDYRGGISTLVAALHLFEGNSEPMRHLEQTV